MFRPILTFLLSMLVCGALLTDAAPAAKLPSSLSSDSLAHAKVTKRASYSGSGTWFVPSINGGSTGSCGEYEGDTEYVVAMNAKQYGSLTGKSGWCFKKIRIHHGGKQVDAVVKDACPECQYGDLDLTPPVFKALDSPLKGVIDITWEEI